MIHAFYLRLLKRKSTHLLASTGGRLLYAVSVTVADRAAHQVRHAFPETPDFVLRPLADVSGDPYARGYVLLDRRAVTH